MFQIIKKFIAPNAIDGSKIKLLNNQSVRVLNTSAVEVEAVKVDGSNVLVLNSPEIDMSANIVKNIFTKSDLVDRAVNEILSLKKK